MKQMECPTNTRSFTWYLKGCETKCPQEWNKSMMVIWGQMIYSQHKLPTGDLPHPHNQSVLSLEHGREKDIYKYQFKVFSCLNCVCVLQVYLLGKCVYSIYAGLFAPSISWIMMDSGLFVRISTVSVELSCQNAFTPTKTSVTKMPTLQFSFFESHKFILTVILFNDFGWAIKIAMSVYIA